jgi:hypothetical protein
LNDRDILTHAGRISHEMAQAKAELEYDKFKVLTASGSSPRGRRLRAGHEGSEKAAEETQATEKVTLTESMVEAAALEWFGELGYSCLGAEALTPAHGERESYGEVVLVGRLREAIRRQNRGLSRSV